MNTTTHPTEQIKTFFTENGYYLAKNVFSPSQVVAPEEDFDGIVQQMTGSGEKTTRPVGKARR